MSFKFSLKFLAVLAFFLIAFKPVSFAEDITNEVGTLRRETRAEKQSAKASENAKGVAFREQYKTGVTYQDILKDPDNVDLNIRYAKDQIARDEYHEAAATLERVLLIRPNLADVRILYAAVLYRSSNWDGALKEIGILRGMTLTSKIKAEADYYEKNIKLKKKRTHFNLRESVGWGYDTNRNAAPHSKSQLVNDIMTANPASDRRRADTNFLNVTDVNVTHDLGFKEGHSVFGAFTYYLQNQTNVNSLDLGSFQYEFGGTYKNKYVNFTPSFVASNIYLSSQSFLRTQGGNFLFDHDFTKKLNGFFNFRAERQDYMNISENNTTTDRKGPEFDYAWGASYWLLPTMKWASSLGFGDKYAKQDYNASDRFSINNTHTWFLKKQQFLINTVNFYFDDYESPEFSVSGRHRHDKTLRYRITYGAPLTTLLIGKVLPKPFKDILFTATYEYYHALSNITNYTYGDNKFQCLLSKRWEF